MNFRFNDDHIKWIIEKRDTCTICGKPIVNGECSKCGAGQLTWTDIADQFNTKFNPPRDKTPENLRSTYKYWSSANLEDGDALINAIRTKHTTSRRANRVARENREILDYLDKLQEVEERFEDLLKTVKFKLHPPIKKKSKKKTKPAPRTVVAHMSDTHYGAHIDKGEMAGLNEYNNVIAARRTAYFFKQVADYKVDHREETDLILLLNGDLAAGIIHNQEWHVDLMTTQFAILLDIMGQGISYIANNYNKVTVVCNTGNHLRFQHKADKGRSTVQKWDSFATMAYVALKREFEGKFPNVEFIIPESPFAVLDIQGHKTFVTHGDTVFDVGNPGKVLKLEDIQKQVNEINSSDLSEDSNFEIFFVGHVHTSIYTLLANGVYLCINGCLSGLDQFANSIKIFGNNPSQQILEVTRDHIGDYRLVTVKEADKNSELDKIITPFTGKF